MKAFASRDPQGKRAFETGVRTGPIDLAALRKLPAGTRGRVFAEHLIEDNLDPASIPVPSYRAGDVRYVKRSASARNRSSASRGRSPRRRPACSARPPDTARTSLAGDTPQRLDPG